MNTKTYLKILLVIISLILVMLLGTTKIEAASTSISASKTNVTVGDSVTINISFTAAAWNLKVSGNGITGKSYASQTADLSEETKSDSFILNTDSAGTYTINLTGDITDSNGSTTDVSKKVVVTVEPKPTSQPTQEPTSQPTQEPTQQPTQNNTSSTTTTEKEPNFKAVNDTIYPNKTTINIRESWTTNSKVVGSLKQGQELTRTGIGDNGWSRVNYNGKVAYVNTSVITTEKKETIEENVNEENQAEENISEETIQENEEAIIGLSNLEIEGIKLSPAFSQEVYEYSAKLTKDLDKVEIKTTPTIENSNIEITGNEQLKEGENVITITVSNDNTEEIAEYKITITKTIEEEQKAVILPVVENKKFEIKKIYLIFAAIVVLAILITLITFKKDKNKENKENFEDNLDEDVEEENVNNEFTTLEQENVFNDETTVEKAKDNSQVEKIFGKKGKHS